MSDYIKRVRADMLTNLSVCKDGCVVALKAAVDELLGAVGVDGFLLRVHIEDVVVGEGLVLTQNHLWLSWHHKCADVTALDLLLGQLRTDPTRKEQERFRQIPPSNNRNTLLL